MRRIRRIYIHTIDCARLVEPRELLGWHLNPPPKGKGWKAPGEHFYLRKSGRLHSMWPIEKIANGIKYYNAEAIHIELEGDGDIQRWTPEQWTVLIPVVAGLCRDLPSPLTAADVLGHREVPGVAKTCPGLLVDMQQVRREVDAALRCAPGSYQPPTAIHMDYDTRNRLIHLACDVVGAAVRAACGVVSGPNKALCEVGAAAAEGACEILADWLMRGPEVGDWIEALGGAGVIVGEGALTWEVLVLPPVGVAPGMPVSLPKEGARRVGDHDLDAREQRFAAWVREELDRKPPDPDKPDCPGPCWCTADGCPALWDAP